MITDVAEHGFFTKVLENLIALVAHKIGAALCSFIIKVFIT